ncbi:MAG TPA: alpha-amylase family glycosyl hydrolase [Candidatus Saccharimonadales bacterium]|nr:alpha-amylase family glycosyl hydrolase [Candidatus Saccharimonadales bacterium]
MVGITEPWFRHAVLYEIYLNSFYDSNGDGVGDLPGIIEKLDYLAGGEDSLGVDAIWITPFYPSPMVDSGYDITDYYSVDSSRGTLDDIKVLVAGCRKRGLKIFIDYIPNHTSDQHPWFQDSRSSRTARYRDWYVWRYPKADGSPPNNWLSVFGGSAWQLDKKTNQYYLHSFLTSQPDLNWENAEVRNEMKKALRFWLDIGVDGFRFDSTDYLAKDPLLRDDPPNKRLDKHKDRNPYHTLSHVHSRDGEKVYERLNDLTSVVAEYSGRFTVAENSPNKPDINQYFKGFYDKIDHAVAAPFNFGPINAPWDATYFSDFVGHFQSSLRGTSVPVYCFSNHDHERIATRYGHEQARTAAMMILTLPGIAVIYNGDELGLADGRIGPRTAKDQFERNEPGIGLGRDPERTPMPWTDGENAGFTTGKPWLPVASGYKTYNVEAQDKDPSSILNLHKRLIRFRKGSTALLTGSYHGLDLHPDVFSYTRRSDNEKLTILLNFSARPVTIGREVSGQRAILSTDINSPLPEVVNDHLTLKPHEGLILR